jgi:potassium voltage-gated channel Shaker-related subfamily A beta protein 2
MSEEGKKRNAKIRELQLIADKLNCTMAQLSIGNFETKLNVYIYNFWALLINNFKAWCLKNESVHCLLLGASSAEQLNENIQALQLVPKLTYNILSDIERILGNKPISRQPSKSENLQKS